MKINLGSGKKNLDGFINIDAIPHTEQTIVKDILNLNYEDETVEEIYSSHVIEHLTKPELQLLLFNCFKMLKSNGILTLRAPSLEAILISYYNKKITLEYLENYLFALHLHNYDYHKQGIYEEKMKTLCYKIGFKSVEIEYDHSPEGDIDIITRCKK